MRRLSLIQYHLDDVGSQQRRLQDTLQIAAVQLLRCGRLADGRVAALLQHALAAVQRQPASPQSGQILNACRASSRHWPPCFCQTCMTPTRDEAGLPPLSKSVEKTCRTIALSPAMLTLWSDKVMVL